jgi:hypothetical protein
MSTTPLRISVPRDPALRESVQSTAVLLGTSPPSILAGYGPTAVQLCVDTLLDHNTKKPPGDSCGKGVLPPFNMSTAEAEPTGSAATTVTSEQMAQAQEDPCEQYKQGTEPN